MARVYADVNQQMPRSYWDYDSVNITWGVLENYEVVRKIGKEPQKKPPCDRKLLVKYHLLTPFAQQVVENTQRSSRA